MDTVHECDRQTDGRTDKITITKTVQRIASHGNKRHLRIPPRIGLDWIEQGLTSPPIQYSLSGRQFYRSKDPTNSIKVLKEELASHRPEEAPAKAPYRCVADRLQECTHPKRRCINLTISIMWHNVRAFAQVGYSSTYCCYSLKGQGL